MTDPTNDPLEPMPVRLQTAPPPIPQTVPVAAKPAAPAAPEGPSPATTAAITAAQAAVALVSGLPANKNTQQALIRLNDAIGYLQK
jgi:hypothetical protein